MGNLPPNSYLRTWWERKNDSHFIDFLPSFKIKPEVVRTAHATAIKTYNFCGLEAE
jgi:hypothetical protein